MTGQSCAQTDCIWLITTRDGEEIQKIAVSIPLVKLFSNSEGDFDINGVKVPYETLLQVYRNGSVKRIKEKDGKGETKIFGGKFDQKMNESSKKHDRLIIENYENGKEQETSKLRVKSIEAVGIILMALGSKDFDNDTDMLEEVLERGGVLYIRDEQKDSRLWIYVN